MVKNLLLFIGLLVSILINLNNLSAEIISLVPLKKPTLTTEEFNKKISKNVLKPLKKPSKIKKNLVEKKKNYSNSKRNQVFF